MHCKLGALVLALSLLPLELGAQTTSSTGALDGIVSTQDTVRLQRALVDIRDETGQTVARQTSDPDGRIRFAGLAPGRYRVIASLEGFQTTEAVVLIRSGETTSVTINLAIAIVGDRVDVVASVPIGPETLGTIESIRY